MLFFTNILFMLAQLHLVSGVYHGAQGSTLAKKGFSFFLLLNWQLFWTQAHVCHTCTPNDQIIQEWKVSYYASFFRMQRVDLKKKQKHLFMVLRILYRETAVSIHYLWVCRCQKLLGNLFFDKDEYSKGLLFSASNAASNSHKGEINYAVIWILYFSTYCN